MDTNVLVAALRSARGASFRLLSLVGTGRFEIALSVALVLEYEDVLLRHSAQSWWSTEEICNLIDYLCKTGHHQEVFYLWRPTLRDSGDDMILELAVASRSKHVVTFNVRDFSGCERFGIEALPPRRFLETIGEIS